LEGGNYSDLEKVDGIVIKGAKSEAILTKPGRVIENLDDLPFASEIYNEFLNPMNYFYGHSLYPLVVFDTSRGCPYHCSFCAYPQTFSGHRMRYRSVSNVADEFDYIKREMPFIKTVMLEDDTFIVNVKRTENLADELILRGNKIPFDSNCRVDVGVDLSLLNKLNKAGARLFCVGFESGAQEVITHMDKNNSKSKDVSYLETAEKFTSLCNEANIKVHGCFMFGNLNETKQTLNKTLDFALKLPLDTAQFYPIMIYPGTKAYDEAKERNLITAKSYDDWLTSDGMHRSVVNLPGLSQDEMLQFADLARRKFYLRPKYIAKKLIQSLFNPLELRRNVKGFKKLADNLIHKSKMDKYSDVVK
jgi:anaerobic magnesium-protoporphyrin IX monomethyl ester cyclase